MPGNKVEDTSGDTMLGPDDSGPGNLETDGPFTSWDDIHILKKEPEVRNVWREDSSVYRNRNTRYTRSNNQGNIWFDGSGVRWYRTAGNQGRRSSEGGNPGLELGSEAGSKQNYRFNRGSEENTENSGGEYMTMPDKMKDMGDMAKQKMAGAMGSKMPGGISGFADVKKYLGDVQYPAAKKDMMDAARSHSAPDQVMRFMDKLPDKTYKAPMEIEEEFKKIM